jgi:uncharacterized protein (DUF58 family)
MIPSLKGDLFKKIKKLEIRTRRMLRGYHLGDHQVKEKGYGLDFEQLSDYQFGHDIRFIDWKGSARANKLLIREYKQEKTRTILIAFDSSASTLYGTDDAKHEKMIDAATALIMAGVYSKDSVGLMVFSDRVESYMQPRRSPGQIHLLLKNLCSIQPHQKKTSLRCALDFIAGQRKKDMLIFMISDFIDDHFEKPLKALAARHDFVAVRVVDHYEDKLPAVGIIQLQDSESGQKMQVNLSKKVCAQLSDSLTERVYSLNKLFKDARIDVVNLYERDTVIDQLMRLFQRRGN